ncbi:MAG TPA: G1 family glutamic endopeptidase [Candidatus Aquilonibacter sp.]|nr:G1 family glutamic endopeptidase [Candidatus Aquilonibacter sp.]
MRRSLFVLFLGALFVLSSSHAMAQDAETVHATFLSAPKVSTSVGGVSILAGPPKGFNPLDATGEELARYGLPQRPDPTAQPEMYAKWARAMASLKQRAVDLKAMPYHSSPARLLHQPTEATAAGNVPSQAGSYNWSGVVNTNKATKWNNSASFTFVQSFWPVPVAQPPFEACANGVTGPFLESTWNGIDGFNSGDVVQGGSSIYSDCSGDNFYFGWVEWYPSYPSLTILCTPTDPCPVGPGDVFYVITYGAAGTADQFVYVSDTTQGWFGTFDLPYVTGPGVIGNSEEQVIERPCCTTVGNAQVFYPLDNYNYEFLAESGGFNGHGTLFFAGMQTPATYVLTMYDDAADQQISAVAEQGNTGTAGQLSLFLEDLNCAYVGGCVP